MNQPIDNLLRHMGYAGSIEVSLEDGCLHGSLLHITDLITYEGETVPALREAFQGAVERYLAHCAAIGKAPERPYTGSFNVRLGADRHRQLAELSVVRKASINVLVCQAVDQLLAPSTHVTGSHERPSKFILLTTGLGRHAAAASAADAYSERLTTWSSVREDFSYALAS